MWFADCGTSAPAVRVSLACPEQLDGQPSADECSSAWFATMPLNSEAIDLVSEGGSAKDCSEQQHDGTSVDDYSDTSDNPTSCTEGKTSTPCSGKLWTAKQFPEGVFRNACWSWANIKAAQAWSCPCRDRQNCIGSDRITPEDLLCHRKSFQQLVAPHEGGLRESMRRRLAEHYSKASRTFTRSFVVGELNDCCAASRGLADGLPWITFARARTDLRKGRPSHQIGCPL